MRETLVPTTRDEVKAAIAYGLRFDDHGRPHRQASDDMASIAAETLVRYLEASGFVVLRRPAAEPHTIGRPGD